MTKLHLLLLAWTALGCVEASVAADDAQREAVELAASMPLERALEQLEEFKGAVRSGSCDEVRALVHFPFRVNRGTVAESLNESEFCEMFPVLFDETRRTIVVNQAVSNMPVGYRGLKFGNGVFWLQPICAAQTKAERCPKEKLNLRLVSANL